MGSSPLLCEPLIGRREELQQLLDRFDLAAAGSKTLVAITGDEGVGKSRLVRDLKARVAQRASRFVEGHCVEHLRAPFLPFWDILNEIDESSRLGEELSSGDESSTALHEGNLGLLASMTAVLLSGPATKPIVAVVEDIHWADAATLGLIEHLALSKGNGPLLLILTLRAEALERPNALSRLLSRLRHKGLQSIHLRLLDRGEMTALLRGALGPRARLPRETMERIKDLAEGNPLFAEELLRAAIEDPGGRLTQPAHSSIRATVLERLYQLSERDQRVLTHAAAIGRFFDARLVARLVHRPVDDVLAALRRARNLQLVRELPGTDPHRLAFRHALFSEVVYRELLAVEAVELHARIARKLERGPDSTRHVVELAYHWSAAKHAAKAVRYNAMAGDQAMALSAFEDAARFYGEAMEASERGTAENAALAEKRAYAFYAGGASERTPQAFAEALAAYESVGNRDKIVEMHLFRSRQAWNDAETPSGYEHAMRALKLLRPSDGTLYDYAVTMAASYAVHLHRPQEALDLLESAPRCGAPEIEARRIDTMANARARLGNANLALQHSEEARLIAERCGDPDVIVRVYSNAADLFATYGRTDEALASWKHAYEIAESSGYVGRMAYAALGYALLLVEVGELGEARRLYDIAIATGVSSASVAIGAAAVGALLRALLGEGSSPEVVDEWEALELAIRSNETVRVGQLAGALACAAFLEGRVDLAQAVVNRSIPVLVGPDFAESLLLLGACFGDQEMKRTARHLLNDLAHKRPYAIAQACWEAAEAVGRPSAQRHAAVQCVVKRFRELRRFLLQAVLCELSGETSEVRDLARYMGARAYIQRIAARRDGSRRDRASGALTARELEVARLIASAESNRSIAERLGISERTVEHHVESILGRLGLRSRWLITPVLLAHFEV